MTKTREEREKIPSSTFAVSLFFPHPEPLSVARCAPVDRKCGWGYIIWKLSFFFAVPRVTNILTNRACQTEICSLVVIRDSADSATRDPCGRSQHQLQWQQRQRIGNVSPVSALLWGIHSSCCAYGGDILCRASCSYVVSFPVDLVRSLSTCYSL